MADRPIRGSLGAGPWQYAKRQARSRFLTPLMQHLQHAGLGHVAELADAEPPFIPRGCPFQAWSSGELLRLDRIALASTTGITRTDGECWIEGVRRAVQYSSHPLAHLNFRNFWTPIGI